MEQKNLPKDSHRRVMIAVKQALQMEKNSESPLNDLVTQVVQLS